MDSADGDNVYEVVVTASDGSGEELQDGVRNGERT